MNWCIRGFVMMKANNSFANFAHQISKHIVNEFSSLNH